MHKHLPYLRLKWLREKQGLTQEKVANLIGISLRTYERKENGQSDFFMKEGKKIAAILKKRLEDIF